VQFRGDRGGARQRDRVAVAGATPVVHDSGGELRNLLLDKEVVQTDRAGTRQEDDGWSAAARPMHKDAAPVDLLEPSDRRGERVRGSAVVRHAARLQP
jgi:hypothetical protein